MVLLYLPAGSWIAVGAVPQAIPAPWMKRVFKKLREILSISANIIVNHDALDTPTTRFDNVRCFPCGLAGKVPLLHRFDMPGRSSSGVRNYWQNSKIIIPPNIISGQKMCKYISWHAMFIYFLCMNRNVEVLRGFWVPIILCTMTKGRPRHRKSQGFIFDVEYCTGQRGASLAVVSSEHWTINNAKISLNMF